MEVRPYLLADNLKESELMYLIFPLTRCDINVDECSSPDGIYICKNGGTCVDGIAQYTCVRD